MDLLALALAEGQVSVYRHSLQARCPGPRVAWPADAQSAPDAVRVLS